jgi:general secretion pathway protein D
LTLANIRGLTRDRIGLGLGEVLINLKREVGDVTTLANPKIRARNKEKAKILIGDKIPIVTSTTGTGGFVSDSVSYLDVGLKLDVEPTVYNDDDVAIKIALEVSTLGAAVKTSSGTLAYQIGTRSASTLLRLHDGETQLLAGLISKEDRSTSSRVPGVGDLPLLGRLFSSNADNSRRTELVLAITPRILRNVRRPDASETELWVGTEALPRLRPVGGIRGLSATAEEPEAMSIRSSTGTAAGTAGAPPPGAGGPGAAVPIPQAIALTWTGPAEVKVGDTVELKLSMNASIALRGMPTRISFPNDRLQLLDVVEGDFFKRDGSVTSFSKGDGKDGQVAASVLRNLGTGALGDGALLTMKFKAIAAGAAAVQLTSAQGVGLSGPAPTPTLPPPFTLQIR